MAIVKSKYVKSVATLVSGSAFAQIITVVSAIVLARIYSPEEMGIYALVLAAESLFGSVVNLRYDVLLVSESDECRIPALIKLCVCLALAVSLAATIVYGGYEFIVLDQYRSYSYVLIAIFIMLCVRGLINIAEGYNNRLQEYKLMTSAYVLRTTVQNGGAIVLGLVGAGVPGIVVSHVAGSICGLRMQTRSLSKQKRRIKSVSNLELKQTMLEGSRQVIFSSPAVFANRFSYSSITMFVGMLFNASTLGYYSISYKALGLPLTVFSNNVSKVFFKEASNEFNQTRKFIKAFAKTSIALTGIAVPLGVVIYFISPPAITLILGESWAQSAVYIQILVPMFCIRFVCNAVAYGLQISNRQNLELVFQLIFVAMSIASFVIAQMQHLCAEEYLFLISITFSISYLLYFTVVARTAMGKGVK